METATNSQAAACDRRCEACAGAGEAPPAADGLSGWRMVGSSAGVFLFPLLSAIGGAAWAGAAGLGRARQALAGVGGLAAGIAAAWVFGFWLRRRAARRGAGAGA